MNPLTPAQRRALKAKAHHLEPVVLIGDAGLTTAVLHEIDISLNSHELIKVRVSGGSRDAREGMIAAIGDALGASPVQHIGKILVIFRAKPAAADTATDDKPRRTPPRATHSRKRRTKRSYQA